MKPEFVIDGARIFALEDFYDEITAVLGLSSWGHNLDAFNDILRGGFGTPEGGFVIRWRNAALSRERLGHAETARQLEIRLEHCHPTHETNVQHKLDEARAGRGQTVFDWLMEIISDHCVGGQEADDGVELILE